MYTESIVEKTDNPPFMTFSTNDARTFEKILDPIVPEMTVRPLQGANISATLTATRLPDLDLFTTRLGNIRLSSPGERPIFGATIPLHGTCRMSGSGTDLDVLPGRFHLAEADLPFDARMTDDMCEFLAVVIDKCRLEDISLQYDEGSHRPNRFRKLVSSGQPGAERFTRMACSLWAELRSGSISASGTALREATDKLLYALLDAGSVSGNGPHATAPVDRAARDAAEYISENIHDTLTLSRIARSTDTSVRSLTRNFRRIYGISIHRFIIDRRLEAVHRTLLTADPEETSITMAAMQFGFWHLGRFSAYYRERFGETPSSTLKEHSS